MVTKTAKKRGLGRGLNELGLNALLDDLSATGGQPVAGGTQLRTFSVDVLQPGKYQPRKEIDTEALEGLAESIRSQGIIQPLIVRSVGKGRYEIIAGERRWRAAQLAELHEVPAVVREISDNAAVAMSLIENIQRENLNVIEEANALRRLLDEFGLTHQEVAHSVGKSRATVTNLLRLLTLRPDVKTMLERGDLEMGHARALLAIEGSPQSFAAKTVVAKGLSVRETERLVQRMQAPQRKKRARSVDPDIVRLQSRISDRLGAAVAIAHSPKGKGRVTISYNSLDELDGILGVIGVDQTAEPKPAAVANE